MFHLVGPAAKEMNSYVTKNQDKNYVEAKELCAEYAAEKERIVAQAGQFFMAGFETVSAIMSFALYEICLQRDDQDRVLSEIRDNLVRYGELTYKEIQEMKYLNIVVNM
ncbi:hypothetical protein ILUMI_04245 [Ignelater luminosus]|uniref:Cytochrome P450 n=1 Tax=Ignelater luminosus TaxID=2038154 RepID=A0A8K0D9B5_IGNLU|nr:hypothetical protein ILUMI_04245 [Ignelater luminosus]